MAGVFKSLDKSDVRLTPFRAHKQWTDNIYQLDQIPASLIQSGALVGFDFATSFGAQSHSHNYYYFTTLSGASKGTVHLVDGNDNYSLLGSMYTSSNTPIANFITNLGSSESDVASVSYPTTNALYRGTFNFNTITSASLPTTRTNFIAHMPEDDTIFVCQDNHDAGASAIVGHGGYGIRYDGTPTIVTASMAIVSSSAAGDYYGAVHVTGSKALVLYNRSMGINPGVIGYINYTMSAPQQYTTQSFFGGSSIPRVVRQFVYNNKSNGTGSYYVTFKGTSLSNSDGGLFIGSLIPDSNTLTTPIKVGWNVVGILSSKRAYRKGQYIKDRTITIVTREGGIYIGVDKVGNEIVYEEYINASRYIGVNGAIVAATINTDHDVLYPQSPTIITMYAVSNYATGKGPTTVFAYNVDEGTFFNPIHLGYRYYFPSNLTFSANPFIGDNWDRAANFNGEFRESTAVGLGYNLNRVNPVNNYTGNYIYTLNIS